MQCGASRSQVPCSSLCGGKGGAGGGGVSPPPGGGGGGGGGGVGFPNPLAPPPAPTRHPVSSYRSRTISLVCQLSIHIKAYTILYKPNIPRGLGITVSRQQQKHI